MSFRYHGNYCGPGWSAGKYQNSVVSNVPPSDEFDATCKRHDEAYAKQDDLRKADLAFALSNIGKGLSRTVAGTVVGLQGLTRAGAPASLQMTKKKLRGSAEKATKKTPKNNARVINPPVANSTILTGFKSVVRPAKDGIRVQGKDLYLSLLAPYNSANFVLAGVSPLNPIWWSAGSSMSQYVAYYEKFKINSMNFEFRTDAPTNQYGTVAMWIDESLRTGTYDKTSGTFLSKVLSTPGSVVGPIWQSIILRYTPTDKSFRYLNGLSTCPVEQCDYGDFFIVNSGTTLSNGYVVVNYDITFAHPQYTGFGALLPCRAQNFNYYQGSLAANAVVGNAFKLGGAPNQNTGDVTKLYFDLNSTTFPAGTTAANLIQVSYLDANNNVYSNGITMKDGMILFALWTGSSWLIYPTYEAACSSSRDRVFTYRTASTGTGLLSFWVQTVYAGEATLMNAGL
jgi:hypothetical protein